MSAPAKKVVVAVGQMTSTASREANFKVCASLAAKAAAAGASLLCLPEGFHFMGTASSQSLEIAEPLDGPWMDKYRQLAKQHALTLSLGGFQEKGPDDKHLYNTHVILSPTGSLVAAYRKVHLFDLDLPTVKLMESSFTAGGTELVVADTAAGKLGLSTCYDMRFPGLFQSLTAAGAQVLLVPSAFTVPTGMAHWEVLLRARAIENQCYVIAAAQKGRHNEKRESYGHALVIDPWGVVVAQCSQGSEPSIALAEVDTEYLSSVRERMPVASHARPSVYASEVTHAHDSDAGSGAGAGGSAGAGAGAGAAEQ